ncbi:squalene--hopene cyclase [Salipaludibacillus neizhouensis]|uniref:Squalene--hopene cyclase n=1 Tax=Salipaludibacillus neizhouensis TaxID=885475 RepID=A0A3A9KF11_9BACI|nr:squalene--hopene cyclase [Salipaludibacillus neizhouensis]RKL69240.1 squalene--hopene cyclase [Salipaludibacillus neizhouensis]
MEKKIHHTIEYLTNVLRTAQEEDGSWHYCFESGPMTDAYMIILLRSLHDDDEELIKILVNRLLAIQNKNGAWKLFKDETDGNLSATIDAYFALQYSGYVDEQDQLMVRAKSFIIKNGGLTNAQELTKVMLSLTGQLPWPIHLQIPIEFILLPRSSPISLYDFVGYARVNIVPILITSNLKYHLKSSRTPDLSDLIVQRQLNEETSELSRGLLTTVKKEINKLINFPKNLRSLAFENSKQFMLSRIEPDGTLYSYFVATFFMVFALLSLGHSKNDPLIAEAMKGSKNLICQTKDGYHLENCTSTVWDTALISDSLQQAGINPIDPMIVKAGDYLLSRQHYKYGDWALNNSNTTPGGWGFSDINTILPDVDDTTASLRAIKDLPSVDPSYANNWSRGVQWVLSMQNNDGGWSAFEKNTDNFLISLLPVDGAERIFIDPSTSDLTGRTLEFLGKDVRFNTAYPQIQWGIQWLVKNQEENGSWYGRWGISYIYGTWAAITGLTAVGIRKNHRSINKGVNWLQSIQNKDGGWGESCLSDIYNRYVPLHASTPSQTAWALDALISAADQPTNAINKGIMQLIDSVHQSNWKTEYPTGAGIPGAFYIHYHSYRYIWPLLTLSHYRKKYL